MLDIQIAQALTNTRLELIILPTEKCNFRCAYCYEDFKIGRMQSNIKAAIKKLILRRLPTLRSINLSWFGGEPLLAYETILDICQFTKDHSEPTGVIFESDITTNGWGLDKDRFETLIACHVTRYQITLDGPQAIHDRARKMIDGRGTFSKIYRNLKMMQSTGLDFLVTLRLHLTPSNFNSVKEFVEVLARDFGWDQRFELLPHTIRDLGGTVINKSDIFSDADYEVRESEILEQFHQLVGKSTPRSDLAHICYAAKANSFLIRPDGRIGKCTVDFYNDRNTVGYLREDGTMQIDNSKFSKWVGGLTSGKQSELMCPLAAVQF